MQSSVLEWVQARTRSKQKLKGDVLKKSDICMLWGRNRVKAPIVFAFSPLFQFFWIVLLGVCFGPCLVSFL